MNPKSASTTTWKRLSTWLMVRSALWILFAGILWIQVSALCVFTSMNGNRTFSWTLCPDGFQPYYFTIKNDIATVGRIAIPGSNGRRTANNPMTASLILASAWDLRRTDIAMGRVSVNRPVLWASINSGPGYVGVHVVSGRMWCIWVGLGILTSIATLMAWKCARKIRKSIGLYCMRCDYRLAVSTSSRCPECGIAVPWHNSCAESESLTPSN
jgi:hypothetical protein